MQYASNDGVELAYELVGPTDAETVALVEGLAYGRWMWDWQREVLADDHQVVVWDNRGTGDSSEPEGPYTSEQMASDLEAVLEDAGIESAHVVGASLGGMIAQQYALEYDRAASLVLMCTTHGGEESVPIPEETQARMLNVPEEYGPAETIRHKMKPAFTDEFWSENQEVVEQIVDWRLDTDPSEEAYGWQAAAVQTFDVADRLDQLDLPALVLHGRDDRVVPFENARLLAESIPDARLEPIEGGSHLFFVERADRVNDAIRTFLNDV